MEKSSLEPGYIRPISLQPLSKRKKGIKSENLVKQTLSKPEATEQVKKSLGRKIKLEKLPDFELRDGKVKRDYPEILNETLFSAIQKKDVSEVGRLLDFGADINALNEKRNSPLFEAVLKENLSLVRLLLQKGADISLRNPNRDTPLHEAVKLGNIPLVRILLENGGNPNRLNSHGDSALHEAIRKNDYPMVEFLLENGAKPSRRNKKGNTPLHEAIKIARKQGYSPIGDVQLVNILLEKGAKVNRANKEGDTPLHQAVKIGNVAIVKALLDNKALPNEGNLEKNTPIHLAVKSGNVPIVEMLVKQGGDPNISNKKGVTPFKELEEMTLQGFDKGESQLMLAILRNNPMGEEDRKYLTELSQQLFLGIEQDNMELLKYLLSLTADPNVFDEEGYTPLHRAIMKGDQAAVLTLLMYGADPKVLSLREGSNSPLGEALERNDLDMARLLLGFGAEANKPEEIHRAHTKNNNKMIQLLIDYGGDPNFTVDNIPYLAMNAPFNNEMCSFLVKKGADPNALGDNGSLALGIAKYYGNDVTENLLLDYGADVNYLKDIESRKYLANSWTLGMQFRGGMEYEGSILNPYPQLAEHFEELLVTLKSKIIHESHSNVGDLLKSAIPPRDKNLNSKIQEALKHEKPLVISSGWKQHNISVVIDGDYLLVINRGEGGIPGEKQGSSKVAAFKIDPQLLKNNASWASWLAESLNSIMNSDSLKGQEFFYKTLPLKLGFNPELHKSDPILKQFAEIEQSNQRMGNCWWVSPKSSVLALLMLQRFKAMDEEAKNDPVKLKEVSNECRDIYRTFNKFIKLEMFKSHLMAKIEEKKSGKLNYSPDHDLILMIIKKINSKKQDSKLKLTKEERQTLQPLIDEYRQCFDEKRPGWKLI